MAICSNELTTCLRQVEAHASHLGRGSDCGLRGCTSGCEREATLTHRGGVDISTRLTNVISLPTLLNRIESIKVAH